MTKTCVLPSNGVNTGLTTLSAMFGIHGKKKKLQLLLGNIEITDSVKFVWNVFLDLEDRLTTYVGSTLLLLSAAAGFYYGLFCMVGCI